MTSTSSNRTRIRSWPRPIRLILYTIAVILTVAIMAGCAAALEFAVTKCQQGSMTWPVTCSQDGRTRLQVLSLVVLTGGSVWWVSFLTGVLAIREGSSSSEARDWDDKIKPSKRIKTSQLPLGQVIMSGRVESVEARHRRITIQNVNLRFWGGYALRNGWIRTGEWVVIVYQRLFGLNYVMVFWKGEDARIRTVGTMVHTLFLALAIVGVTMLPASKQGHLFWLVPACATLFVASAAYLFFIYRARRALHDAISSAG